MKYTEDHWIRCPTKEIFDKVIARTKELGLGRLSGLDWRSHEEETVIYPIDALQSDAAYAISNEYPEIPLSEFLGEVHENNYEIY